MNLNTLHQQTTFTTGARMGRSRGNRDRSANKRGHIHDHNPAGSKAARMAFEHRLTVRR